MRAMTGLTWVLVLAASPAWADRGRTLVSVAGVTGKYAVDGAPLTDAGAALTAGQSFGPLQLQLEYSFEALTGPETGPETVPRQALLHRVGATVRVAWWHLGAGHPGYMDLAFDAGVGRTFLTWDDGRGLNRNDVVLGVSSLMLLNAGGSVARDWGVAWGLRVRLAEPPGASGRVDSSLVFHAGLAWGR